jgi:hypothetical protein
MIAIGRKSQRDNTVLTSLAYVAKICACTCSKQPSVHNQKPRTHYPRYGPQSAKKALGHFLSLMDSLDQLFGRRALFPSAWSGGTKGVGYACAWSGGTKGCASLAYLKRDLAVDPPMLNWRGDRKTAAPRERITMAPVL